MKTERDQLIEDLLVTALDSGYGGSLYWADTCLPTREYAKRYAGDITITPEGIDFVQPERLSFPELIFEALWLGHEIEVLDVQTEETLGRFTYVDCENALDVMRLTPEDDFDAWDADTWYQYAVLGEVVFG